MDPLPIPEGSGRDVDTEDDAEGDPCRDPGGHEAIPGSQCLRGHECGSRTSLGDAPGVRQRWARRHRRRYSYGPRPSFPATTGARACRIAASTGGCFSMNAITPGAGTGASDSPRPQSSRRGWRTAGSPRRCTSRAARGRRHLPRYCSFTALGRPPARSDRPASAVRVIASRGMESCRSCRPDDSFSLPDPPSAHNRKGERLSENRQVGGRISLVRPDFPSGMGQRIKRPTM